MFTSGRNLLTLQTPQATVHSSEVAEVWFAWHSIPAWKQQQNTFMKYLKIYEGGTSFFLWDRCYWYLHRGAVVDSVKTVCDRKPHSVFHNKHFDEVLFCQEHYHLDWRVSKWNIDIKHGMPCLCFLRDPQFTFKYFWDAWTSTKDKETNCKLKSKERLEERVNLHWHSWTLIWTDQS